MTMNPVELERTVRQVDNDVQSIYVMLAGIQGSQERHTNRLNELAARLDTVHEELASRLDGVETAGRGARPAAQPTRVTADPGPRRR